GPEHRRPGESERWTEIVVIRVHPIRLQEVVGIEACKSGKPQYVCQLSEILIAEPECDAHGRGRQPHILEEVRLAKLIRMENSCAKIFAGSVRSGGAAEIVQEVGEGRVA